MKYPTAIAKPSMIVVVLLSCRSMGICLEYHFKDAPLTNITDPQPGTQVVSPAVYEQLGSQDKALQDVDRRFAEINQKLKDQDSALTAVGGQIKPLQETNLEVRFLGKLLAWIFGLLGGSSVIGLVVHYLREHWPHRKQVADGASLPQQSQASGLLKSVYAASEPQAEARRSSSGTTPQD